MIDIVVIQLRDSAIDVMLNLIPSLSEVPFNSRELKSRLKKDYSTTRKLLETVKGSLLLKDLSSIEFDYCKIIECINNINTLIEMNCYHPACCEYRIKIERLLRGIVGYWTIELNRVSSVTQP